MALNKSAYRVVHRPVFDRIHQHGTATALIPLHNWRVFSTMLALQPSPRQSGCHFGTPAIKKRDPIGPAFGIW